MAASIYCTVDDMGAGSSSTVDSNSQAAGCLRVSEFVRYEGIRPVFTIGDILQKTLCLGSETS